MLLRRVAVFAVAFCFTSVLHAQTIDVTGTWSGTITGSTSCPGAGTAANVYTVTLKLQQSGSNVTGNGVAVAAHQDPCHAGSPAETDPITAISGSMSGSMLTVTITIQTPSGTQSTFASATVNGDTMSFSIATGPGKSSTGTLTRQAAPSVDVSGSWSGTFNASDTCSGSGTPPLTIQWSSAISLQLAQDGNGFSGVAVIYASPIQDERCNVTGTQLAIHPVSGSVIGNTLTGTSVGQEQNATLTAQISGNTMTMNVSATGFSASATLTRTSTAPLDSHLSGSYSGSFTETLIPCPGTTGQLPPVTYSGSITGMFTQVGSYFNGSFTVIGTRSDQFVNGKCTVVTDPVPETAPTFGQITGNTVAGTVLTEHGRRSSYLGTVNGNTITGSVQGQYPGEGTTFSITKNGATAAPPSILAFTATPNTIRAGDSSTLSWSTDAATMITIDNNVGFETATGSTTVTPATTTTYTLTAKQGTQQTTATATVTVLTTPVINVTSFPNAMLQPAGSGGATASYAIMNSGGAAATVTLTQNGSFFTQAPASFSLAPGATTVVTITGTAQTAGSYEGASIINGSIQVPVKLLSAAAPSGTVTAVAVAPRVDVAAPPSSAPSGTVQFTNTGNATLTGILTSDVPWMVPQTGQVTIAPGATATFNFTIDRTKRPDAAAPIGSVEGSIALSFLQGTGSSFAKTRRLDSPPSVLSVTIVKVVDTSQPAVTTAGIPGLGTGEVALFIPGVGHVTGLGNVQFASDVNLLNAQGGKSIDDLKLYYLTPASAASSSKSTSINTVPNQTSVALADVVKSVFAGTNEVGTLQVRSKDADKIVASARVLTTNNPSGSFGNTIPVFRSDRSTAAGAALVLNGLRKDSSTHTNLYVQETSGNAATVQIDYIGADGSTVSSSPQSIDPFKLLQLNNAVPVNAVAAFITNTSTSGGRISAYATPVDEKSTDTWAIADWAQQLGYAGTDPVVIPIAGNVHGANGTFYRTDVAVTNRGTTAAVVSLRYVARSGATIDKQINIDGKQTNALNDVVGNLFNVSGDSTGYIIASPQTGSVAISSRTYTTTGSSDATFGTGVPAIPAAAAIRIGGTKPIAGLADAARTTVVAQRPGTYRTNFGLMETAGQPVTVRVTFRFTFPAGEKAQGIGAASRDYALNANGFLLLNSIAGEILGTARLQYGDLTNVEADFQVVDGAGGVMLFTSSVDNATGDSILRTE